MADQLLEQVRDAVEGQIVCAITLSTRRRLISIEDFEGQRLAEMLTTVLLGGFGVRNYLSRTEDTWANGVTQIMAFLAGYITQDITLAVYIGLAGTVLTFVVIVPPWPFFNKNPEGWLPAQNGTSGITIDVDGEKVG